MLTPIAWLTSLASTERPSASRYAKMRPAIVPNGATVDGCSCPRLLWPPGLGTWSTTTQVSKFLKRHRAEDDDDLKRERPR